MMSSQHRLEIILVRNSTIVGGVETTLVGWLQNLDSSMFRPTLYCFQQGDGSHEQFLGYLAGRGLRAELLPWGRWKNLPLAVVRLAGAIRSRPGCIVHTQDVRADLVGWIASRFARAPLMASNHGWHGIWPGMGRKLHWVESLRASLLKRFDLLVEVCESTRQESIRRGISPAKTVTIPTGVDISAFRDVSAKQRAEVRREMGVPPDEFIVGNVARLYPEKGQMLLLESAARLLKSCPAVRFWIIGDGPLLPALKARAGELGIGNQVRFLQFQDDLVRVMSALDIFALPSFAEGAPLVIYKAMAMGIPIVATRVAGNREILEHEITALLIEPGDTEALTKAIGRLAVRETRLRSRLGQAARDALLGTESLHVGPSTRTLESAYLSLARRELLNN